MEKSSIEREHYLSFNISQRYDEFSRCRTAFLDKPNNKYFGFLKTKQNKTKSKQNKNQAKQKLFVAQIMATLCWQLSLGFFVCFFGICAVRIGWQTACALHSSRGHLTFIK